MTGTVFETLMEFGEHRFSFSDGCRDEVSFDLCPDIFLCDLIGMEHILLVESIVSKFIE